MIHVCFGLHDADGKYSKFVGTTMTSIFEKTFLPVTIHILHDASLIQENRDKISYLAGRYDQFVEFYNVEELCSDEIRFLRENLADKVNSRFSIGAFYRLLAKKVLKMSRVIYLDADIIVNLDISELWQQDLRNFPIAAVPEIEATQRYIIADKFLFKAGIVELENYFCSGVILIDLDKIDENFFYAGLEFLIENPQCESPDQDILNAFFSENYLKLAQKFDSFVIIDRRLDLPVTNKIYHYAGQNFGINRNNPYDKLFLENFALTPFFNVETLFRLGDEIRKSTEDYVLREQWLMKICFEHRRAFFIEPSNILVVKMLFNIQNDEPIIKISNESSINELLAKMRELRGQKIFFIFFADYVSIKKVLIQFGFKEVQDFVNGLMFMTGEQCGYSYMNPEYNFVKAL